MKTKIFLFICLFIGMAVTTSSAQDKANKASQGWNTYTDLAINVFCDGQLVDVLYGDLQYHYVIRSFKNGLPYVETDQLKGELVSHDTGETFRVRRTDKWEATMSWYWTCTISYNFIGDMGTIYSGKIYLDYSADPIQRTFDHLNCH
ncbi:hypothetical protein [uncultured Draconibacterium sp.]|uniref:hypothetical protein n=1 Tax=uncultured Draconibacterium sp. TaxID=1573823 RepID=UPI0025F19427|nr:hypothetical protein [uncultured Draconibacterium sp.]